ncbi:hypothetical protein VJ923_08755 [Adlercreutzia sp. R25]|uniref:Uncharacterized protein n=1 Tax=Adlercreutzia shanghongiae TaxID=3111773 RepID=A0ABU6J022_9ACTN|nr:MULTISPECIES: hypothetical protein [unclassified Adlercreutzia]MEC4273244.1 hypothetical protein [Adlercreutzia sp. R25]MEC4295481.1 hypothetical protein [Adlercreutzia sp. R22]
MALAIALGVLAGIAGFAPLVFGLHRVKHMTDSGNLGHMGVLMLCLIVSFVLMFAFAIICINVNRDAALPFVLSEAGALSVTAIIFGVSRLARKS